MTNAWLGPVLEWQVSETLEVLGVDSYQYESIGVSDCGNLTIHVRGWSTEIFQTCPFAAMPGGGDFVVG